MKHLNSFSRRTFLLAGLVAAFFTGNSSPLEAGIDYVPPGDLTVTVEEQGDGAVKITLSGTANMQGHVSSMDQTNFSSSPVDSPPFARFGTFDLPAGLTLTVPGGRSSAPESSGPEEIPAETRTLAVYSLEGSNLWRLSHVESDSLGHGDTITGAGSITTKEIPFNLFTPGTFTIDSVYGSQRSESESSGVQESPGNYGYYPYSITYKVIAFVADPSLSVTGPGAFPKTLLRKSSGSRQVMITNNGNAPLTDLILLIYGLGAQDFPASSLSRTSLPSGASTMLDVRFRPKRNGQRSARLMVKGLYTATVYPELIYTSAEEIVLEPVMPPARTSIIVTGSTNLSGKGISAVENRRNLSPRFPRGRR